MDAQFLSRRLNDLADHIDRDWGLLKEYEDLLRLTKDPKEKQSYLREIESLRASAAKYQVEREDLLTQASGQTSSAASLSSSQLQQVSAKLDALMIGVNELLTGQQKTDDKLSEMRQSLLAHYEAGNQATIASVISKLDQAQFETMQSILSAIEANRIAEPEMRQLLGAASQALTELRHRGLPLPKQDEVEQVISDGSLDIKHKLKFVIPLLFVEYEAEVELGSGVNLSELLRRVKKKILG
jgi:hypothetical protein